MIWMDGSCWNEGKQRADVGKFELFAKFSSLRQRFSWVVLLDDKQVVSEVFAQNLGAFNLTCDKSVSGGVGFQKFAIVGNKLVDNTACSHII